MEVSGLDRSLNDNDLISLIADGSNGAFIKLSEMYSPLLKKEVERYSNSVSSADLEDLRQVALVSLYRAALAYDSGRGVTFGLFAKVCIVNGIADALRYLGRRIPYISIDDVNADEQSMIDAEFDPQNMVAGRQRFYNLRSSIETELSKLENRIFDMYIGGYSYSEIAKAVGKDEKAVDNALYRIKQKLRKNLK